MSVLRPAAAVGLLVLAGSCRNGVAPRPAAPHAARFVEWAQGTHPRFTTVGGAPGVQPATGGRGVLRAATVLSLNRYVSTFWAVRGQARSLQIDYLSATGDTSQPFLQLSVSDPTSAPGRDTIAVGDSVLVTVTVDTSHIGISLEPTGLQFGTPAQLQMWYTGAHGDFNGDGIVDSTDANIEAKWMGLSYHEWPGDPWTPLNASHSVADQSFSALLAHFSEYAVSW